jgi:hypothetical protein|tara:strand:+ start:1184 stop:1426 length:243 start_codon:yes stop_codon:yes gene_type:complete
MRSSLIDKINVKAEKLRERKEKIEFDWERKISEGQANHLKKIDKDDKEDYQIILNKLEEEKEELLNMVEILLLEVNIKNI